MPVATEHPGLTLVGLSGPELEPLHLEPGDEPRVIGRGSDVSIRLEHKAVSRRHAVIERREGRWQVQDLGSRHGTVLNGVRLKEGESTPLNDGDRLRILPWTFLLREGSGRGTPVLTYAGEDATDEVRALAGDSGARTTASDLELLLRTTSALHEASDEAAYSEALLDALVACGFERAAILTRAGGEDDAEVLASRGGQSGSEPPVLSRTLLRTAGRGEFAQLIRHDAEAGMTRSGVAVGVCAPILLDDMTWGFLYADSPSPNGRMARTALLVQSLSRIASDALARLKRVELYRRLESLHAELTLAASAQALLMPAEMGRIGGVSYAARSLHGQAVSGDLLDVVEVGRGRTAVVLGDVVGKGAGAGMLMVLAQSFLHARLTAGQDVSSCVAALNRHLCPRLQPGQFISLWAGVFDAADRTLEFVDAGHGYAAILGRGAPPRRLEQHDAGGPLVGIESEGRYPSGRVRLEEGERVLTFSDGLVEQRSPEGGQLGVGALLDALAGSASTREDVEAAFRTVLDHAGVPSLKDDATLISAELV